MPISLTNQPGSGLNRIHLLWLGVFVLCTALQLFGLVPELRYDRHLISDNGWWRLFSAQLVHIDWPHWVLNMTGVAIVAFFFSNYGKLWHWLLVIGIAALFVGVGIHLYNPEVNRYVGLSGVLHGLFIFGAIREISRFPTSGYVLTAILIAKLAYEYFVGVMPFSESMTSGRVITDSHLYGAIGGVVGYIVILAKARIHV